MSIQRIRLEHSYVGNARIAEPLVGDVMHRTLLIDFASPQRVLSTTDGMIDSAAAVGISFSPTPMWFVNHLLGLEGNFDALFRALALKRGKASLLFTGADINSLAIHSREADGIAVTVLATLGMESPTLRMARGEGRYRESGTVNIILLTDRRLLPGAMTNAIVSVTEAKTEALRGKDFGTGRDRDGGLADWAGTDGVIVVQGDGPDANWVGGRAKLGQLIGEAVYNAIGEALQNQKNTAAISNPPSIRPQRRFVPQQVS